ncbi:MAG: Rap1a/Tai family immunity protein [Candidatus Binatia bacterium]
MPPFARHLTIACASLVLGSGSAATAVTREDFLVTSAQDLIDVCSVPETDPMHERATSFCHGFVTGVVRYHDAMTADPRTDLFCPPEPQPTRQDVIQKFVAWGKAHPQYAGEQPVDALFKFLVDAYPCTGK